MSKIELNISEEPITANADIQPEVSLFKKYKVTAETGLFKHGRLYEKGEEIELHPNTGATFEAIGEVEEL